MKPNPASHNAWQERSRKKTAESAKKKKRKPLPKVNRKRLEKLRVKQFGANGEAKRKWIVAMPCGITGRWGSAEYMIEPAHVGSPDKAERRAGQSTRGNGADSTYLFPMHHDVHFHFDNLDEAKWEERYGCSKDAVREAAADLHERWLKIEAELALTSLSHAEQE